MEKKKLYINKNAGNIEANIQAFNKSTFTGGLMEAGSEKRYFYYWSPIYLHSTGELWSEDEQARTKAVSREKAICNIKHKFFRQYGRAFNLKDEYLHEEPITDYTELENSEEDHVEDPKYNFDDIDREDDYMVESSNKLAANVEVTIDKEGRIFIPKDLWDEWDY